MPANGNILLRLLTFDVSSSPPSAPLLLPLCAPTHKTLMFNKFCARPELGKMANYEAKRVKNCARREIWPIQKSFVLPLPPIYLLE